MTPPRIVVPAVSAAEGRIKLLADVAPDAWLGFADPTHVPFLRDFMNRSIYRDCGWCPNEALINRALAGRLMVLCVHGEEAGFLNFTPRRDGLCNLSQVAIDEQLWRSGLGSLVVSRLIVAAHRQGCSAVTLKCRRGAIANLFWPTLGFVHVADMAGRRETLHAWSLPLKHGLNPPLPPPSQWGKRLETLCRPKRVGVENAPSRCEARS